MPQCFLYIKKHVGVAPWLEFSPCLEGHRQVSWETARYHYGLSAVVIYLSTPQNIDIVFFEIWGRNLQNQVYLVRRTSSFLAAFTLFFLVLVHFVKSKLRRAKLINCLLNHLYRSVYFNSYTGTAHPDLHFEESVLIFWMTERYSRGCKKERAEGAHFSCGLSTRFNHQFQTLFSLTF